MIRWSVREIWGSVSEIWGSPWVIRGKEESLRVNFKQIDLFLAHHNSGLKKKQAMGPTNRHLLDTLGPQHGVPASAVRF